jgi:hypothetical protein
MKFTSPAKAIVKTPGRRPGAVGDEPPGAGWARCDDSLRVWLVAAVGGDVDGGEGCEAGGDDGEGPTLVQPPSAADSNAAPAMARRSPITRRAR